MLTITNKALSVVRTVTAHPKLDESSALCIAQQRGTRLPGVRAVERPQPGDVVTERSGGRVYVGPNAVRRLRGKTLDVRKDSEGRGDFLP
jgi:Fe-S cluster assembly iron-binding protein IscA